MQFLNSGVSAPYYLSRPVGGSLGAPIFDPSHSLCLAPQFLILTRSVHAYI